MKKWLIGGMMCLLLSGLLSGCEGLAGQLEVVATLPPPEQLLPETTETASNAEQEPLNLARGAQIFATRCASCHGENGNGQGELVLSGEVGAIPSFLDTEHMQSQTREAYYDVITNGRLEKLMPPWSEALSERERRTVAEYVYLLHTLPENAYQTIAITGKITHGTAGSTIPQSLVVALRYGNTEDGLQEQLTTMNADGTYQFDAVPNREDYAYVTLTLHRERTFASTIIEGTALTPETTLPITIYERTEDPFIVSLSAIDTLIEPFQLQDETLSDGLLITQNFTYNNASDRLFSLEQQGVVVSLLIPLPPGAIVLNATRDPRFIVAQEQFAVIDTLPIPPGEHTVELIYFVPYQDGAILEQALTTRFEGIATITTTPKTLTVIGEGWLEDKTPPVVNTYSKTFNTANNGVFGYELTGSTVRTASSPVLITAENLLAVAGVGVLLIALLVGGWLWWARRWDSSGDIEGLMKQIAHLDSLHQRGEINHDAYQQQRQALKTRLAVLLAQQKDDSEKL